MSTLKIDRIHHVAYRCKDAKETVEWYQKYLNMRFILAIAENEVPSTKEPDPYMHIFLDAGNGNTLATVAGGLGEIEGFIYLGQQSPILWGAISI